MAKEKGDQLRILKMGGYFIGQREVQTTSKGLRRSLAGLFTSAR